MAENELISQEDVKGIDINQVDSMQLKDGTVVVISKEGQPEITSSNYETEEQNYNDEIQYIEEKDQSNQLRARPMMGRMILPPKPVIAPRMPLAAPIVAPIRPIRPKPVVVPRGPMRGPMSGPMIPMARGPILRGRPFSHYGPRPAISPMLRPFHRPYHVPGPRIPMQAPPVGFVGSRSPVPKVVSPLGVPGPKPLVNQIIQGPNPYAFRARPEQKEEDNDFQEEEYAGDNQYYEYDGQDQQENSEVELRARPFIGRPMLPHRRMGPRIVPPVPKRVLPIAPTIPRRGPVVNVPMAGYNTFQPRLFRARPRSIVSPTPMFIPLNATFQPRSYGFGRPFSHHPGKRGYIPPPMSSPYRFRTKPRSNSSDGKELQEQVCETECKQTSVCTRCGKEF